MILKLLTGLFYPFAKIAGSHHLPDNTNTILANMENIPLSQGFHGDFGTTSFPRSKFGKDFGAIVFGWPSKGGYYSYHCSVAELEFLGLDRLEPVESSVGKPEEEIHCAKMRQLGAKWYPDQEMRLSATYNEDQRDSPRLYVGWPASGGVWALNSTYAEAWKKGLGKIGNAFTMEERCEIIKQLGGVFYANAQDCPHLDLDGSNDLGISKEEE